MKKIVCALVVLILAVPASAATTITAEQDPCDVASAIIGYTGDDVVRCFGLDIQLDNDETIIAVECLSNDYYVNPQKFTYNGVTPDFGVIPCLCAADDGLLPGLDSNGITIAMCSLYADSDPDHNVPPATANGLVKITVSGSCCITITENGRLGGVLDEDNVDIDPTLPNDPCLCLDTGCQCFGDIVGAAGPDPDGIVSMADLGFFMGYLGPFGPPFNGGPVPAGMECLDVAGAASPVPDGVLSMADLGAMMSFLGPYGPPFNSGTCMPAPPTGP